MSFTGIIRADKGKVMGRHSLEDDPNEDAVYWPEEDQDEEVN